MAHYFKRNAERRTGQYDARLLLVLSNYDTAGIDAIMPLFSRLAHVLHSVGGGHE